MSFVRGLLSLVAAVGILAAAGCTTPPVEWTAARTVTSRSDVMALGPGGALLDDSLRILAEQLTPPALACVGSMRAARAGNTVVAVWWSPRADSSVRLLSARTTNGGRDWSDVAPVDTTDRSAMGCHHTAPAIAADSASGYVHVTYALLAEEGPGLFFAHSMDGGITFHSPVPIIYGERLGNTSVAASGGHVVVAFEDPNSRTPRIGLALSRTMGHIFEDRMLPVSDDNGSATQPLVAVRGHRVTVAWRDGSTSTRGAVLHVRDGTIH